MSSKAEQWSWWVGRDGEHYTDEYATREEAVQIARGDHDGAYIVEATKRQLQLAEFFDVDSFLEWADESATGDYGNEDGDSLIELSEEKAVSLQSGECPIFCV